MSISLLLVAIVSVAGCGGDSETSALADDRYFTYVRHVDNSVSPATATVDIADFLTGSEATRAAVEAGVIQEGETVENDYFVRNDDRSTVILPVADAVRVTHVQCVAACREKIPGTFEKLAASFSDSQPKDLTAPYRGASSQYWVTVHDGEVVAIDEMYLP